MFKEFCHAKFHPRGILGVRREHLICGIKIGIIWGLGVSFSLNLMHEMLLGVMKEETVTPEKNKLIR